MNRIEVLRKDWMFKLIGSEKFRLYGDCCPSDERESCEKVVSCEISIEPLGSFSYQYSLTVGGKPFKTFIEKQVGSRAVLFYLFISWVLNEDEVLNLITCEVTLQLLEEQAKILKTWLVNVGGLEHRVVLAKETQVWPLSQSLFFSISGKKSVFFTNA